MKPSKPTSDSITEIDGIRFEAVIIDSMVKIPPKQLDAKTEVEFGIKITNCGETTLQFLLFFLMPDFLVVPLSIRDRAIAIAYQSSLASS